jgi:hypothetical protein
LIAHNYLPKENIMEGFFLTVQLSDGRSLCVSPLSDRRVKQSGQQLDDLSGYFLYEKKIRGHIEEVEVMARVLTEEAALRLAEMLGMGYRSI